MQRRNTRCSSTTLLRRGATAAVALAEMTDRYEALAAFLTERHSYDEPEIVATPFVAGSASFLTWITEETRTREEPVVPAQQTRPTTA